MILTAVIHSAYEHCATPGDIDQIVYQVLRTLDPGDPWQNLAFGETASLYFADTALTADTFAEPPFTWTATHELTIAANNRSGFGALRWDTEWVSLNPEPPADPAVVGDPYMPTWFHPQHAISLALVESAIRQFCGTEGARPTVVDWTPVSDQTFLTPDLYRSLPR